MELKDGYVRGLATGYRGLGIRGRESFPWCTAISLEVRIRDQRLELRNA